MRPERMIQALGRRLSETFGVGEPSFETSSGNGDLTPRHDRAPGLFPHSFNCRLGREVGSAAGTPPGREPRPQVDD